MSVSIKFTDFTFKFVDKKELIEKNARKKILGWRMKEKNTEIFEAYKATVKRNLYEIAHALMNLKVLTSWDEYTKKNRIFVQGESFFSISERALFNDMISHAIKVLEIDKRGDSSTFWYVLKQDKKTVEKLKSYSSKKISSLRGGLAVKLKHIRDKTHFHIDKDSILDPNKIWLKADIKGNELKEALQYLFILLEELYEVVFKKPFLFHPDDYDGQDLIKLLDLANEHGLIKVSAKNSKKMRDG